LGAVIACALVVAACAGPPAETPADETRFEDARAIAATPDGTLWVADADAVVALRPDLSVLNTLGGVGTGEGAFFDPVAIDPTNGLAVFVADRAGGAVLQFTAEGRLAQTLAIPDVDPSRPVRQPAGETGREAARAWPIGVAAGVGGRLFVLDGGRRHVLRLDPSLGASQAAQGAVEAVLGASGAGALADPVALALAADGTLWVADAGRNALVGFDPFGAFVGRIELPDLGRLVGVAADGDDLFVAGEVGVARVRDGAATDGQRAINHGPNRGVAVSGGEVVVLRSRYLMRMRAALWD